MKIFKRFTFDAAHRLPDWPDVHGHSYQVEAWFEGPVIDGYVIRESVLTQLITEVRGKLDHKYLNDIITRPTSENIAKFIWAQIHAVEETVRRVIVYRASCEMGVEYSMDDHINETGGSLKVEHLQSVAPRKAAR